MAEFDHDELIFFLEGSIKGAEKGKALALGNGLEQLAEQYTGQITAYTVLLSWAKDKKKRGG